MRHVGCALLAAALLMFSPDAHGLEAGEKAPDFAARSLTGSSKLSLSKFRGKVVYLDFWASWCPPCMKSLPLMEELRSEFPADEFQILAVNVDKDLDRARQLLERFDVKYPSASDPQGRLPETFGIETMPTSFVIDQKGVIRYVHRGFRPKDMSAIRDHVRSLMGPVPGAKR